MSVLLLAIPILGFPCATRVVSYADRRREIPAVRNLNAGVDVIVNVAQNVGQNCKNAFKQKIAN